MWSFPYYHPETRFAKAPDAIAIDDFAVSKTRPQSALRRGKYKLLQFDEDDRVELYDLSTDIGEQHNLVDSQPQLADPLSNQLRASLAEMKARLAIRKRQL